MSKKFSSKSRPDDELNRRASLSICGGASVAEESQVIGFDDSSSRTAQVSEGVSWRASTSESSFDYVGFLEGDSGRSEFLG